jgi:hypothetical protein
MKKILSLLLITFATSLCFTACTEEDVQPNSEVVSSGRPVDPF